MTTAQEQNFVDASQLQTLEKHTNEIKHISTQIKRICMKYGLNGMYFRKYCINKFQHKQSKNIFYIQNECQCGEFGWCDICEDFWKWEWDHYYADHKEDCGICNRLKRYYIAQAEFFARYSHLIPDNEDINDFNIQKTFSSIFGGKTGLHFEKVKPIVETAIDVCKSEKISLEG